jgi:hypothetical protein
MPPRRKRESLDSVKERLVREQIARTERRVRQLLQQDISLENSDDDDSEEDNRQTERHNDNCRRSIDQATQTDSASSWSFCCGVFVGVLAIVCVLSFGILASFNDGQRGAKN